MEEYLISWGAWVIGASVLLFLGSIWLVSWLIIKLPADYFLTHDFSAPPQNLTRHYLWVLLRNILGTVLILAGIAMLVLPGQGFITIVLGLSLMSFPGKRQFVHWILDRKSLRRSMNWIRRKAHQPPLIFDHDQSA